MREVLDNLEAITVLKQENIAAFREYIQHKFPGNGVEGNAQILANTIHRVIEGSLSEFADLCRADIRSRLLREAVEMNRWDITAADIFNQCLTMKPLEGSFLTDLTHWINSRQNAPASKEELVAYQTSLLTMGELTVNPKHGLYPTAAAKRASDIEIAAEEAKEKSLTEIQEWHRPCLPTPLMKTWLQTLTDSLTPLLGFLASKQTLVRVLGAAMALLILFMFPPTKYLPWSQTSQSDAQSVATAEVGNSTVNRSAKNHLPASLQYKEIHQDKLMNYLIQKNSLLADDPYFSAIINAAAEFNINPLLLFAITGQEQGFVPKTHKDALTIANNPFNVFQSWKQYNTDIQDSARIAARTVVNLSKDRPSDSDPIHWINRKYAEDQNWWLGVSSFLQVLEEEAGAGAI